jgi:hypothetical protein
MALTAWSTASMRAMQLSINSLGGSFFCPIRRRATTALRSQGSFMACSSHHHHGHFPSAHRADARVKVG